MPKNGVEKMECGSSLAELEYGGQMDVPRKEESSSESPSPGFEREAPGNPQSIDSLRSLMASDVLKDGASLTTFSSPFEVPRGVSNPSGKRCLDLPLVYCDQTASNRPVKSIEKYMEDVCLPFYGNTHTNTSITGSQSTAFVAEARQIVAEETNAKITGKASLDVVLFAGNGATSAVELLIDCLGLQHASADGTNCPVVFVGPYEHHSNLIPWRESGCEIVMVPECENTRTVDIVALERLLQNPKHENRLKMGTFTAASNVTGKVCDVDRIAATLHRFGALAFFDYATGAAYMSVDMNPPPSSQYPSSSLVAKDAVFLSPHKMLGGVGTPGVLIIKKHLVDQVNAPRRSGGGTVFYVTSTHHRFLSNRIERYEGGSPNVVGILRAGLAFLLKRKAEEKFAVLADRTDGSAESKVPRSIEDYDCLTHERVANYLREHAPNLVLLGGGDGGQNLPIFSFLIRFGSRFLHYNYVCAILNDVFGIQSRGGCQCSGPYSQRLLGLTEMTKDGEIPNIRNEAIESALLHFKERAELLRPGYTRISLPFKGLRAEEVDYVLKALVWVSENGWSLMCQYRCNHRTGEWRHSSRQGKPLGREERKWLSHYNLGAPTIRAGSNSDSDNVDLNDVLNNTLSNADEILRAARNDQRNISQALKMADVETGLGEDDGKLEELRWYVYPKECAYALTKGTPESPKRDVGSLLGALCPSTAVLLGEQSAYASPTEPNNTEPKESVVKAGDDGDNKEEKFALKIVEDSQIFMFRDGEHTGEALFEEISAGFDDGEVSEACEIFDSRCGEWVPFKTFLQTAPVEIFQPAPIRQDMPDSKNETLVKAGDDGDNKEEKLTRKIVEDSQTFMFRDGEHTGEALFEEISAGFDDGEVSEACEIFDSRCGEWVSFKTFLQTAPVEIFQPAPIRRDMPDSKNETLVKAGDDDDGDNKEEKLALKMAEDSQMFMFRDGEHTGEALFEEISAGFDDGEVSEACEIFDSRCGEWVSFNTFIKTAPVEIVQPVPIRQDKSASKNEKKKASRGSSSWGQGRVLPVQAAPLVGWAPSIDATDEAEAVQREDTSGSPQIPEATTMVKRRRTIHFQPPKKMMRLITQAVLQWDMLADGDKLLLGLSGGKDSLSLLHCLMEIQRKLPITFEIEVCTIDPMTPSFDPSPLIPYVESLGLKHHYIRDDIVSRANSSGKDGKIVTSLCAYCARMKRGNLYACARSNNCNKLVLAQHLDDCAESFMMSLMHNGFLRTMKANYKIDAGDLSVIRPMVYCRESLMTEFAKSANLPVINENCPACFEEPKERARIKKLLNREETLFPNFYDNIRHSLIPLMHDDLSAILKCYTEDVLAKTRKKPKRALIDSGEVATSSTTTESQGIEKPELQSLRAASDDDLVRELARRRAEQFLLSSGKKGADSSDPTGQVCTLNGGNGSIPCYELME